MDRLRRSRFIQLMRRLEAFIGVAWFWKGALLLVENDILPHYLPQFSKYRLSVIAMYATEKQFRAFADVALIPIRPVDNVFIAISDLLNVGLHL